LPIPAPSQRPPSPLQSSGIPPISGIGVLGELASHFFLQAFAMEGGWRFRYEEFVALVLPFTLMLERD
jgi:hypothetical protein